MTAILALENCDLDEKATASEFAIKSIPYDYSVANIEIGEEVTIKDLLYVLMLHSANEAAYVLAEHIGGSVEGFAKMMNDKAKELGCKSTNFVNPNGIQDENHYSSAYDLALISSYAMQNETFRQIVKTTSYTMAGTEMHPYGTRAFNNTNHLILPSTDAMPNKYYYPYAIGIKTGYTSAAQNCLVSCATKGGVEYICVVLGSPTSYENGTSQSYRYLDSIELFNYAFDNYKFKEFASKDELLSSLEIESLPEQIDVASKEDITVLVDKDVYKEDLEPNFIINEDLEAPIKKGDVIGKVEYTIGDNTYSEELISLEDIDKPLIEVISTSLEDHTNSYILAGSLLGLGVLGLIICIILANKKDKTKKQVIIEEDKIIDPSPKEEPKKEENKQVEPEAEIDEIITDSVEIQTSQYDNQTEETSDDELSGELSSNLFKKR